ncbi:GTP cyclohydrolase I FolE [Mycetocola reblochoni]|uniref:GTP cyclohydrolase 1 n=2 Tax=Mycetocola reblochoni TaxID=331618 RepID=A0A1R4I7J4_9MICO|nr:GTP cyclohydrolase I FolE [Mycetocola reblochoni]RLP68913.1 GTP cyclohydrolase I FolE [Mycetocola reblochoni]SJN15666.1 GTP cyclohydrolase I type 1 [Mycetocola reblochoni REB411]
MAVDAERVRAAVAELIAAIGEDPSRPGLEDTPRRVAESYAEFFAGVDQDPAQALANTIAVGEHDGATVVMRDIALRSVCEHHLLPFLGTAHIAYAPAERVVGLGSLPRVVGVLAARPQVQERLTEQIAAAIDEALDPRGVLVVIEAAHGCVTMRGPRQIGSTTVTLAARGSFAAPAEQAAALALIGRPTPATGSGLGPHPLTVPVAETGP